MALLIIIALAQLVVCLLILSRLGELTRSQLRQPSGRQTIYDLEHQTIEALFAAEAAARVPVARRRVRD